MGAISRPPSYYLLMVCLLVSDHTHKSKTVISSCFSLSLDLFIHDCVCHRRHIEDTENNGNECFSMKKQQRSVFLFANPFSFTTLKSVYIVGRSIDLKCGSASLRHCCAILEADPVFFEAMCKYCFSFQRRLPLPMSSNWFLFRQGPLSLHCPHPMPRRAIVFVGILLLAMINTPIATEMDAEQLWQLTPHFCQQCGKQLRAGYTFSSNTCSYLPSFSI